MAEKGFFEGLLEDFCKHLEMKGAIEASRDESGKIDVAKATGIIMIVVVIPAIYVGMGFCKFWKS